MCRQRDELILVACRKLMGIRVEWKQHSTALDMSAVDIVVRSILRKRCVEIEKGLRVYVRQSPKPKKPRIEILGRKEVISGSRLPHGKG